MARFLSFFVLHIPHLITFQFSSIELGGLPSGIRRLKKLTGFLFSQDVFNIKD